MARKKKEQLEAAPEALKPGSPAYDIKWVEQDAIVIDDIYPDSVMKPAHYTAGRKIEPIDAIEDWGLDFRLSNVIKYVARAGRKDPLKTKEDLLKAKWYLERYLSKEFP